MSWKFLDHSEQTASTADIDNNKGTYGVADTPGSAISCISTASGAQSTSHSHHGKALLTDSEEAIDSAQTSALNFAEVLAPLLFAASALDDKRRAYDTIDKNLQRALDSEDSASTALRVAKRSQDMLSGAIGAISAFESRLIVSHGNDILDGPDESVNDSREILVLGKSRPAFARASGQSLCHTGRKCQHSVG